MEQYMSADSPPTERPGYTTTEFWLTLATTVLSFVTALLALLTPGFKLDPAVSAVVAAGAPVVAMIGASFYSLSRSRTKAATATITTTQMGIDADQAYRQTAWDLAVLHADTLTPTHQ